VENDTIVFKGFQNDTEFFQCLLLNHSHGVIRHVKKNCNYTDILSYPLYFLSRLSYFNNIIKHDNIPNLGFTKKLTELDWDIMVPFKFNINVPDGSRIHIIYRDANKCMVKQYIHFYE
jgi:hypothetical protein